MMKFYLLFGIGDALVLHDVLPSTVSHSPALRNKLMHSSVPTLQLRYGRNAHGKPHLLVESVAAEDQWLAAHLQFNLSHTSSVLGGCGTGLAQCGSQCLNSSCVACIQAQAA